MHLGEISFCDRVAFNVKCDEFKEKVLKDIEYHYGINIIQRHFQKYTPELLDNITKNPHLVTFRTNGNPYFLYLTKVHFVNVCIFIDKKIQHGYFHPRMILSKLWFDDSLFSDTLMDGEMVKCKDGSWVFLLNDLLAENRVLLLNINLPKRIERLNQIITTQLMPDETCPFTLQTKQYHHTTHLQTLLDQIPNMAFTCRGIYIKPLYIRFKDILVNFDDSLIQKVIREKFKDRNNFMLTKDNKEGGQPHDHILPTVSVVHAPPPQMHQSDQPNMRVYWVRKTSVPDTYELFLTETGEKDIMQGYACVSSLATSKILFEAFRGKNLVDRIPFECKYTEKFNKWTPVKIRN
jgi:hypothetical protein